MPSIGMINHRMTPQSSIGDVTVECKTKTIKTMRLVILGRTWLAYGIHACAVSLRRLYVMKAIYPPFLSDGKIFTGPSSVSLSPRFYILDVSFYVSEVLLCGRYWSVRYPKCLFPTTYVRVYNLASCWSFLAKVSPHAAQVYMIDSGYPGLQSSQYHCLRLILGIHHLN